MRTVAGSPVTEILTTAPGNGAAIGGVKVCSRNGWFAIRPSGTEAICKVYAESFLGEQHLHALHEEAQALLQRCWPEQISKFEPQKKDAVRPSFFHTSSHVRGLLGICHPGQNVPVLTHHIRFSLSC